MGTARPPLPHAGHPSRKPWVAVAPRNSTHKGCTGFLEERGGAKANLERGEDGLVVFMCPRAVSEGGWDGGQLGP